MEEKRIHLKVITPEKTLFFGDVLSFIVKTKGENGEFAVLYDHMPMASLIGIGSLVLNMTDGETKVSTIFGGYMVVNANSAVILAQSGEWPDEIDFERAEDALHRANERLLSNDKKFNKKRALDALERAKIRLSFKNI